MASLRMLRDDALYRLSELKQQYSDSWDVETQIRAWHLYCQALINAGYVGLLADTNPRDLSLFLARAAANWRVLLLRARTAGFVVPAHRNQPLLGLVAIDDLPGAAEIALLSARTQHDLEYEDEFLYAFLLQEVIAALHAGRPDPGRLAPLVMSLRAEAQDERPDICQAVLDADGPAFWAGLAAAGKRYRARMEASRSSPSADYFAWRAAQHVWLEGLALVRLGARLGFGRPPDALPCLPPAALQTEPVKDDGKFLLATA